MKTKVEFRSSKFPLCEGEEQMNPGVWGKLLTEYFIQELSVREIETGEVAVEDWGYYLPIRIDGVRLALCCGHRSDGEDAFLVFTDPSKPKARRLFRTVDVTPQLDRLLKVLRQILAADSEIYDVQWCAQE